MSWFAVKVGDGLLFKVIDLISKSGKTELNDSSVLLNYSESFDEYNTITSIDIDLSFLNKSGRDAIVQLTDASLHYKGNTKHLLFKGYNVQPIFKIEKINAEIKKFTLDFLVECPRILKTDFDNIIKTAKFELNFTINKVKYVLVVDEELKVKCTFRPGPGSMYFL